MRPFRRRPTTPTDALDPGPVALRPRHVSFDISDAPLHWIPGQPVASHIVSAFNFIFPEAERFFIDAFTEALPLIDDARLREDVLGFIGQETVHADTHEQTMSQFFARHGIDTAPLQRQIDWIVRKVFGPRDFDDAALRHQYLVERLAVIGAAENFTAFLGDFALNNNWQRYRAHVAMAQMWRWHGAEEMEHRTVAHDVATYFDDSYLRRIRALAICLAALGLLYLRAVRYLAGHDPAIGKHRFAIARGYFAGARRGLLPTPAQMLRSIIDYLRPSYTPDMTGSMAQALTFLARVEAEYAA
ncbi:metal-dependent hydrolase [Nocardia terpenica]|uniref:Metal-dependent hydrolase n=2 Tax=Nocardia terpenica TaxID=455432 RepID=A0A6G9ZGD8_9NOCA|nr:metal-dependent hydrolase [Nocardia terpenica]